MDSRSHQLSKIADTKQFQFQPNHSSAETIDLTKLLQPFRFFNRKKKTPTHFSNLLLTSKENPTICLFDWNRTSVRTKQPKVETIFFAHDPSFNFPISLLRPENTRDRALTKLFGSNDIDFVASPLFSKRYWLEGKEKAIIRTMFTRDIRSFLSNEKSWYIETTKNAVIITKHDVPITTDKFLSFHQDCSLILEMLVK